MYPLIRPQDRLKPIFKVVDDRRMDLEYKLNSIRTSQPVASQIRELDKAHKKILALISLIQGTRLHFAMPSYTVPVPDEERVPKRVRDAFDKLISFLSSLDRNNHNNLYVATSNFFKQQEQMLFELSDKIITETLRLRRQQQQKQQKQQLFPFMHTDQQQILNQLQPPQLTRHYTGAFSF